MTLASDLIRTYREGRSMSQKEAAYLLEYNQGFLSQIETGVAGIPKNGFVDKVVKEYNLTMGEELQLNDAIKFSNRYFKLPVETSANTVWLFNAIFNQLDHISKVQIDMIALVLKMKENDNQVDVIINSDKLG